MGPANAPLRATFFQLCFILCAEASQTTACIEDIRAKFQQLDQIICKMAETDSAQCVDVHRSERSATSHKAQFFVQDKKAHEKALLSLLGFTCATSIIVGSHI